jgi:TonB-dependent receptor
VSRKLLYLCLAPVGSSALLTATAWAAPADSDASAAPEPQSSTIVVTAPREEEAARQKQHDAPNLINVQSAETIAKYPDFNAAESLGRIPGVSLSSDTGEGRFVNIRGIDGNLAGATFGGVPLLNTFPGGTYFSAGGRAVEYDTVPIGSVDGIIVTKTLLPDHEAEGLGGTIELTPRTAANINHPFLDATVGAGYEPAHDHEGPNNFDFATGFRFGFDGGHFGFQGAQGSAADTPFSILLTASWREDWRGFDDIEGSYNNAPVDQSYNQIQMRQYNYHRRRFGYGGEFTFEPSQDHRYYVRANQAGYVESVAKDHLYFQGLGDVVDPADPNGFATTTNVSIRTTDEEETHRNQVYAAGGADRFGGVDLDYRASYSRASYSQGKNFTSRFNGPQGLPFTYDNSRNDGDKPAITVDDAILNNPASYKAISSVDDSTELDADEEFAYAANVSFQPNLLGDDHFKVGAQARLRDKTSAPLSFTYDIPDLSLAAVSGPPINGFYGRYAHGPKVDLSGLRSAALAGVLDGPPDPSGFFKAREDIYAGYAQYQTKVGPFGLLAGVRVESTQARYGAFSDDTTAPSGTVFVPRSTSYTNAFPTVQLRYDVTPDFLIRATYSTGIGRPGFNQVAESTHFDTNNLVITTGNPNLKPTTGQNFDLTAEYYLPHGGILQLGAFDKEFNDYIVTIIHRQVPYPGANPAFIGTPVDLVTFANRPGAYARGIEAAWHQQFTWLPGWLGGLGVEANATLVDSQILEYDAATSDLGRNESGLLPGTSRETANLAGFYERGPVQLRLAGEFISKELFSLGGSKPEDTIQDDRLTVDLTSSYHVTPNWAVYFNVKNLTNAPLRFFVTDPHFPVQREYYDETYEAGVRATF